MLKKNKFAMIIAAGLTLAPVQLLAQSAPPPQPGTRAAPTAGTGGSALPAKPGQRVGTTGTGGGSAAPANPGAPSSNPNGVTGR
jgi:hypothetical protein